MSNGNPNFQPYEIPEEYTIPNEHVSKNEIINKIFEDPKSS